MFQGKTLLAPYRVLGLNLLLSKHLRIVCFLCYLFSFGLYSHIE